jgi:hypothetical protein
MVVNEKHSQFNAKKVQRFLSKFSRKFPQKVLESLMLLFTLFSMKILEGHTSLALDIYAIPEKINKIF